jgi:putative spermidine/putrescine transport system permease protein
MFDELRDNIDPSILAMSTLLVIISVVRMSGGALVQKRAAADRAPLR